MRGIAACLGALICAGAIVAAASAQTTVSGVATIPHSLASPEDPGQAIINVHTRFTSIESACFDFTFDARNGLDPGESLRITPDTWLKDNPFAEGPGFANTTGATQFSRELCVTNFPGAPPDPFLAELVDGKERLALNADDGPVIVASLTVTIARTT
jgi:hypothetical protein